MIVKQVI